VKHDCWALPEARLLADLGATRAGLSSAEVTPRRTLEPSDERSMVFEGFLLFERLSRR